MSLIESPVLAEEEVGEIPAIAAPRNSTLGKIMRVPFVARILKHIPPQRFGRYFVVGIWNTIFAYACFAVTNAVLTGWIHSAAWRSSVAYLISLPLSFTTAYLGYKIFVFKTKGNYLREWLRCCAVYLSAIIIGVLATPALVTVLKMMFRIDNEAPYIAGGIVQMGSAIYSFLGHSKFSFKPRSIKVEEAA